MVHADMDIRPQGQVLRTKDFAVVAEDGRWYIAPVRARLHGDPAAGWLLHEPVTGLHKQFWSHEHQRYEAVDDDEASALLYHVQKVFNDKVLN